MRINCEILDLKAFLAVLDLGSFHKAADQLNMSQPALSRRIQSLELALGASLLERSTRRVAPTRVGRELDPMLRRLIREFEDCVFCVGDFGAKHSGQLTITSVPTAASAFLPRILKRFRTLYPDIGFRILDVTAKEGLECVARGEAEFGINFMGASRPELKFTPLIDDEFVVACRTDHAFASQDKLRWRDLAGHPLIVSQKSGNRAVIDQALAKFDLRLDWSFEVGHLATSFGLIEAGVGMSIIPRLARPREDHPLIAVVPLCDPVVKRTIGIVERRSAQLSRAAAKLRELLVDDSKNTPRETIAARGQRAADAGSATITFDDERTASLPASSMDR
jgi:DNA-binding transcriptional LysR family regulator